MRGFLCWPSPHVLRGGFVKALDRGTRKRRRNWLKMAQENGKEAKVEESAEIRVTTLGKVSGYVAYAKKLLAAGVPVVSIRGTGRAMSNVVETAEVLKYTIKGLHQVTCIDTQDRSPESGDSTREPRRAISFIIVYLSTDPTRLDTKALGYQPPLDQEALDQVDVDALVTSLKISNLRKLPAQVAKFPGKRSLPPKKPREPYSYKQGTSSAKVV